MSMWIEKGRMIVEEPGISDIPDGEYMTLEEYGKSYGIKPETLRVMIQRGQIRSIKVLQRRYIEIGVMPKKRRLSL